jgi:hypothetical protein
MCPGLPINCGKPGITGVSAIGQAVAHGCCGRWRSAAISRSSMDWPAGRGGQGMLQG